MSLAWRERWLAWRNARLADPRFQAWAARFPPTRGISRANAAALFDLVAGFVYAQTLFALVDLGILEALRGGPQTLDALAAHAAVPPSALARLAQAGAALDLVERLPDGRYALGARGAMTLGSPGLPAMIRHHAALYRDLADPAALLRRGRGTAMSAYWPYAEAAADETSAAPAPAAATYSALMAATQPAVAAEVLAAYSMRRTNILLDVGGGEGAFAEAAARRWPHLSVAVFDLPTVAERAAQRLAPLGSRARAHPGDVQTDPLPHGADLVTLIRVLHDHDDDGVARILRRIRAILPPGGRLLIAEPMLAERGRDKVNDAYFGLYLLAMGRGRTRRLSEIAALARAAGFARVHALKTHNPLLLRIALAAA